MRTATNPMIMMGQTILQVLKIAVFTLFLGAQIVHGQVFRFYDAADLGAGNAKVKEMYFDYLNAGSRCGQIHQGQRILVTGFGLFQGQSSNISGALVKSAMSSRYLPSEIDRRNLRHKTPARLLSGKVASPSGVDAARRQIEIDGKKFDICFLVLNVIWDYSPAVVVAEMQAFQPERVIMFGRGSSKNIIIEGGAQNKSTTSTPGYDRAGKAIADNRPLTHELLPDLPEELQLSIDQRRAERAIEDAAKELGYEISTPEAARSSNDYLCNEFAFAAQSAAQNRTLSFAGGELVLRPKIQPRTDVGFIHLPANTKLSAQSWMKFLIDLIVDY